MKTLVLVMVMVLSIMMVNQAFSQEPAPAQPAEGAAVATPPAEAPAILTFTGTLKEVEKTNKMGEKYMRIMLIADDGKEVDLPLKDPVLRGQMKAILGAKITVTGPEHVWNGEKTGRLESITKWEKLADAPAAAPAAAPTQP